MDDWLYIAHPSIPIDPSVEPARVTRDAFDEVWTHLGWTETTWTDPNADFPVPSP